MSDVINASVIFFGYAVLAIFAQNAVFTRALGVSRLMQLVGDDRTSSWLFSITLCITQVWVAPLAWAAGGLIAQTPYRAMLRPLVYLICTSLVCVLEQLILRVVKLPFRSQLLRLVPLAGLNSCVLGTVLVERTQSFSLEQSLGFGLGSGLGYILAVLLITEARQHLHDREIPSSFRGLPIMLIYTGVLALAIYGFTGHSVIL